MDDFRVMLSGGRPNSLGRTVEVVEAVLADRARLGELLDCYGSDDPLVRLRASNALKRVEAQRHDWLAPVIDRLLSEVGALDQASAQWTLAQLFGRLAADMDGDQRRAAEALLRRNLVESDDWIVLNTTIDTLAVWARTDADLRDWLRPHLQRLSRDGRKSLASRASKLAAKLS
ncbi:hypothetical protein [Brevundimonas sp.]|jgi:hypothetical protein|uniref:hypothetical protein n=1 Tax=Brevundimonas sp. TaxID=1871086 RepID=UPI002E0E3D82|nr:hypothetical protein [Brevundimonas sp.]